jgi:hypothetical protein
MGVFELLESRRRSLVERLADALDAFALLQHLTRELE